MGSYNMWPFVSGFLGCTFKIGSCCSMSKFFVPFHCLITYCADTLFTNWWIFIHSPVDGHWAMNRLLWIVNNDVHCFRVWWVIINTAAINIHVQVFGFHTFLFFLSTYLGMELLGHVINVCNVFRNCRTVFQGVCTIYFPMQYMKNLSSPHTHQLLLLFVFFTTAILVGVKWYFVVALNLFFVFLLLSRKSSFYVPDISFLSDM
jgi:hypothetical protein